MSAHNMGVYEVLKIIIFQSSTNIVKYALFLSSETSEIHLYVEKFDNAA